MDFFPSAGMSDHDEVRSASIGRACIEGSDVGDWSIQLRYTSADPYALWITFAATDWCYERSLLLEALAGVPSGEGDVRIRCDDARTYIDLTSPDGRAVLSIPRDDTEAFARATLDLVPRDSETLHLDMDAVIAALVTSAGDQ